MARQRKLSVFGPYIRRIRESKGIQQVFVAETLGYTQSYLSQIESGEIVNLTEDLLRSLARILGVSYDEIMIQFVADKYNWKPLSDWTSKQDRIRNALTRVQYELDN